MELLKTEPIEEKKLPDPLATPELSSHTHHKKHPLGFIGKIIFFFLLFAFGVGASLINRLFISEKVQKNISTISNPSIEIVDQTLGWNTHVENIGLHNIFYRLPKNVLSPVCDGVSVCVSKGTYLPNGTRFTISSKKTNTPILNFTQLIVKDAGGKIFETKEASVAGKLAVDFFGTFTGVTTGGYAFTTMHGVMIQITPIITVEMNHFAPNGITTEFEKDDAIFSEILKTVTMISSPSATVK